MSTRPRRQAALKPVIIISDSEEDEGSSPKKRTRKDLSTKEYDKAGRKAAVSGGKNTINKQRWPSKEKSKTSRHWAGAENVPPVPEHARAEPEAQQHMDAPSYSDDLMNSSLANESLPPTTSRSSFWERRRVWDVHELLAETTNINNNAARNIVNLFENENTIPFICRYRRDLIDRITPEKLRDIKNSYTEIVNLRKKAEAIVSNLEKENVINEDIRTEMMCAKTTEELEFLYAPYKPASKGSLAERAKALGLVVYAERILKGEAPPVRLEQIVDRKNADLDSVEKVATGICNIISHTISKHTAVLEELRRLQKVHQIYLKSSKIKETAAGTSKDKKSASSSKAAATQNHHHNKNDNSKFEIYFDFQNAVRYLKPHQILAINRGETLKFLRVKIITNDYLKNDVKSFISEMFMSEGLRYEVRTSIFEKAFEECYTKKLQPLLTRQIRADLNAEAKNASIDVFAKNLKQLLLISPLKGERILGIDPGFTNGCKLALISERADVLDTGVIYPHTRGTDPEECGEVLAKMLTRHNCKIIALGNGTACRETEFWLSKLFELGILDGQSVRYSIVSEQGASIYSCSEVARKEFPKMDMNEISAVSIARRLNDPLSEYVKIEPRHIGVGMYQHDINEKQLGESLNEVVSECVSYVGVDINTASLSVLKHIAGLSEKKADKIIQHRQENGPFRTRKDLLQVKSIGEKTFVQCAGFIRIEPRSVGGTLDNPLDCTWVHPESYGAANKIIKRCKLPLTDMGSANFIAKIREYATQSNIYELVADFKIPKERLEVVLEALQRELFQDYRSDFDKRPLFKQGITRLTDLSEGDVVTGAVTNITHFGAFVDIGVECDGLIHSSKMKNTVLNIGDRVTASIVQVDVKRRRISLRLEDMLLQTDTSFTFA